MFKDVFKNKQLLILFAAVALMVVAVLFISKSSIGHINSKQLQGIGLNTHFQLASEDTSKKYTQLSSVNFIPMPNHKIVMQRAGNYFTLMLTDKGEVYAVGDNEYKQVNNSSDKTVSKTEKIVFSGLNKGEKITEIDASRDHSVAMTNKGRVFTWGSNYSGQLGDGTNQSSGVPYLVKEITSAVHVAAGYRHTAIINSNGEVYAWGGSCSDENNKNAQVSIAAKGNMGGYGSVIQEDLESEVAADCSTNPTSLTQSKIPIKLNGLNGRAKSISLGYGHILVLTEDGKVFSAGCNTYDQLGRDKVTGNNKNDLALVVLSKKGNMIAAGFRHSVVLLEDGSLWLWGYNGNGTVLQVNDSEDEISRPARSYNEYKIKSIEAGHDTTFAVDDNNKLYGWGQDDVEAFWPKSDKAMYKVLGQLEGETFNLSAGREHLLVLSNK